MKTLARQVFRSGLMPDPLPTAFTELEALGVRLQRKAVCMVAGIGGCGKSLFALTIVARLGVPTLYFSADTDEVTTMVRAGALLSGRTQDEIEEMLRDPTRASEISMILSGMDHVRWVYNDSPTYYDLEIETMAMSEALGNYPELIVVDNVTNLVGDTEDEWRTLRESNKAFKHLGRVTGAGVLALHHMNEPDPRWDSAFPLPRSFIQGRNVQLPEMVLAVASDLPRGCFRAAPVKNRWGRQDRTGRTFATMWLDPVRMTWYPDEYTLRSQTQEVVLT